MNTTFGKERRVTVEMTQSNFDWLAKIALKSGRSLKYVLNRMVQCVAEGKPFRVTPPMKLHKGRRIKVEAPPWEPPVNSDTEIEPDSMME